MRNKKFILTILITAIPVVGYLSYIKFFQSKTLETVNIGKIDDNSFSSNTIDNVNYISKDTKGNEYVINAKTGEIDINNSDIIYLTDVDATVKLKNSNTINIQSDYGKYNTKNFDTIFSKNVIIEYLENKITGEYLDFSIVNNLMVISRNIVYTNLENILLADVLEMNIQTKDTKIFMYESKKKVNIKSKN